jgi:hypothetical protein
MESGAVKACGAVAVFLKASVVDRRSSLVSRALYSDDSCLAWEAGDAALAATFMGSSICPIRLTTTANVIKA